MHKRYVVIGNWIDKKTGHPKSNAAPINEGVSKDDNAYQITETDNTSILDGTYPVGTILQSTTTFAADKAPAPPPAPAPKPNKV